MIASAPDPSPAQVDSAIAAARAAFDAGPWADAGPEQRAGWLNQLGAALLEHADAFFGLAQLEWGCTGNERVIHVEGPAFSALHAAELATHPVEEQIDAYGAAGTALLRYEPLGVVSILTPWNFPHTLNVMKVCAALAAGNTVVLKPSPLAPLAGLALARIIDEHTDIPPGVVNVVTPSEYRIQQAADRRPADRHGQLHRKLGGRPGGDGRGRRHHEAAAARVRWQVGQHRARRL